jgi:heavy metal translocating P-type ATPase
MFLKKWIEGEAKPTILCVVVSSVSLVLSLGKWCNALCPFDISWIAIILCGIPILYGAIIGLICYHDIKADVLVSLALIASVYSKEYFAAGEVAFIMQIGTLLEDFTANRAKEGIQKLLKLSPQTARVIRGDETVIVAVEAVRAGDVLSVIAGETIPVDGIILSGNTTVNQAVMTGESIPVDKTVGDQVTSGTVNQFGTFTMRAEKECKDSSLQRMIYLAQKAEAEKAPVVHQADRWATWMVLVALSIAIITWIVTKQFIRAVTVLVVFCPCAFILATPTAFLAGIGNLTKHGILVRSGDGLERLSKITHAAFDKTGTLTYGKPEVTAVIPCSTLFTKETILRMAASVEQHSEHPLGKAIVSAYTRTGNKCDTSADFTLEAGNGVCATVNGMQIFAGKRRYIEAHAISISEKIEANVAELQAKGATVIFIATSSEAPRAPGGTLAGIIALADTIRSDAKETVSQLGAEKITSILLTGDNDAAAKTIAAQAGIAIVQAGLLPEDKMNIIKSYETKETHVCMIGDGINDTLALSSAYAGIAMGGIGSDSAVESSDAVLVSDDIKQVPYLFFMAKKTMQKVFTNICISLSINTVAVVLSVLGLLNPVTGALVHNCGSVFVVINAALLLRYKNDKLCS